MNTHQFQIRAYGRTELALAYSPDITPEAAWKKLKEWIKRVPGLSQRLSDLGYTAKQRVFTPAQVKAITDVLGEP